MMRNNSGSGLKKCILSVMKGMLWKKALTTWQAARSKHIIGGLGDDGTEK
jgi:hypothetical protein